ncbi:MAG: hypothetical protein ACO1QR_10955, partial [Chthoniobacteraceae bacterium]
MRTAAGSAQARPAVFFPVSGLSLSALAPLALHAAKRAGSLALPMSSEYKVKLEVFEGPLDLLLYLIK